MTLKDIEVRGWKEICAFLKVQDKRTAKKRLKARNLLIYDDGKPVLNITAYQISSVQKTIEKL